MEQHKTKKPYHHLVGVDRSQISILRGKGYTQEEISQALGISQSTVSREPRRNQGEDAAYDPARADFRARTRRQRSKYQGMKVAGSPALREYVIEKLSSDWSPEQIAGRLKWIDQHLPYASHEAIYTFAYSAQSRGSWQYLRRSGYARKRRRRGPKTPRAMIPHRHFIEERPRIVDDKSRCGDFEADRIESGRDGHGALLVVRDRTSGYLAVRKVNTRKPDENAGMLVRMLSAVAMVRTLTYDNDLAFRYHEAVNDALGSDSYFCHPYHSWEKGGVENENGLIRQYVPKGADISRYTQEYVRAFVTRLNARPRKRLCYKTPFEVSKESAMLTRSEEQKNTVAGEYALEG